MTCAPLAKDRVVARRSLARLSSSVGLSCSTPRPNAAVTRADRAEAQRSERPMAGGSVNALPDQPPLGLFAAVYQPGRTVTGRRPSPES